MIRTFDFVFSLVGLVLGFPALLTIYVIGLLTGSLFFRQKRAGPHQQPLTLVKFRTMTVDTASVASHPLRSGCAARGRWIRHTCETLNWSPPVSVDEGFRAAASAFLNE